MAEKNEPLEKRIGYVAHPVGGDVPGNIDAILGILGEIRFNEEEKEEWKNLLPIAPYIVPILYLDDEVPEQRKMGMEENQYYFKRGFIDVLILAGPVISSGMYGEIEEVVEYNRQSQEHKIDIICHTRELQPELDRILDEIEKNYEGV